MVRGKSSGRSGVDRPARAPSLPSRRRTRAPARPDPVVACRLRVALPPSVWIGRLSRSVPDARIEVLARLEADQGRMLTDLRIVSPGSRDWVSEIESLPSVVQAELLGNQDGATLVRVVHTSHGFLPMLAKLRVLRQFPFPIVDGHATWTIICRESRLRRLVDRLRHAAPEVKVEAVHSRFDTGVTDGLTARQREIFHAAMAFGYFEVPRHVSLTELAERMGLSKSTLSEALAIVERKILMGLASGEGG